MGGGGGVIQENSLILFIETQLLAKLTNYVPDCTVEVCKFTYGPQATCVMGQVPSEHLTLVVRARCVGAEGTHATHRLNVYHYVMLGRVWMQALHVLEQGWVTIKEVRLGSKGWHRCGEG